MANAPAPQASPALGIPKAHAAVNGVIVVALMDTVVLAVRLASARVEAPVVRAHKCHQRPVPAPRLKESPLPMEAVQEAKDSRVKVLAMATAAHNMAGVGLKQVIAELDATQLLELAVAVVVPPPKHQLQLHHQRRLLHHPRKRYLPMLAVEAQSSLHARDHPMAIVAANTDGVARRAISAVPDAKMALAHATALHQHLAQRLHPQNRLRHPRQHRARQDRQSWNVWAHAMSQ